MGFCTNSVCYARIFDSKRKFMEAAQWCYNLSLIETGEMVICKHLPIESTCCSINTHKLYLAGCGRRGDNSIVSQHYLCNFCTSRSKSISNSCNALQRRKELKVRSKVDNVDEHVRNVVIFFFFLFFCWFDLVYCCSLLWLVFVQKIVTGLSTNCSTTRPLLV